MSYNSKLDELFLADFDNELVRAIHLRDNRNDQHEVYRVTIGSVESVCHMSDSDLLLVCSREHSKIWLVALIRNGSEWCEAHRVQTQAPIEDQSHQFKMITCAVSNSRVLVGQFDNSYKYMELFCVKCCTPVSIAHIQRINITERYRWFSANRGSDTLVELSYFNLNEVRVHLLRGDQLEILSRTELQRPGHFMWLEDRLLVTEWHSEDLHSVVVLRVSDTRLERSRQIITAKEQIYVWRWCAVDNGFAIFDRNSNEILNFKFL